METLRNIPDTQFEIANIEERLLTKLKDIREQSPQLFSKPIYVLSVIYDNAECQLEKQLQKEREVHSGKRIILVPCCLENTHWIGILVECLASGQILRAEYIDPVNGSNVVSDRLQKKFAKVYQSPVLQPRNLLKQNHRKYSAELTIKNLLIAAEVQQIPGESKIPTAHISEEGNHDNLQELEQKFNSSLRQQRIKDVSMLNEELRKVSKQIDTYEKERKTDAIEREVKRFNELKQLRNLWDEIIILRAFAEIEKFTKKRDQSVREIVLRPRVSSLNRELELHELQEELQKGLEKLKIRDVDMLPQIVRKVENRIKDYEAEERMEDAQKEKDYLYELQKLQNFSDKLIKLNSDARLSYPSVPQIVNNRISTPDTRTHNTDIMPPDERKKKLLYITELRDEANAMPTCARKTTIELLVHFEERLLGESPTSPYEETMSSMLHKLKDQVNKEELFSENTKTILHDLKTQVASGSYSLIVGYLNDLLKNITALNVPEIQRLVAKAKETAELICNKDIILLIGTTGAGKSTAIQFLAGATMKEIRVEISPGKYLEHITAVEPIKNPDLNKVISSPFQKSETRYIAPVTVPLKDIFGDHETDVITLCDAPGFDDTAGSEVDIANSIGVIEALKGTKSVKLLVLASYISLGDRGQGIQKLAHILISMVHRIEDRLDAIFYAFTKYPEKVDINALLLEIKRAKVDGDPTLKSDTAFVNVLKDMIKKTNEGAFKIDPIRGNPQELIEKLNNINGIKYPEEVFRFSMSEGTRGRLADHVQRDKFSIICALKHKDNDLVVYYLNDLQILKELIKESFIRDAYEESIRLVSESISQYCTNVMEKFNRALASQDGLQEKDILDYQNSIRYLEQTHILKEHLKSSLLSSATLIQNIISELNKISLNLNEEELHSPLVTVYLDNFRMLKNSFRELEENYNSSCKKFEARFDAIVKSAYELIPNNNFKQIAEILRNIFQSVLVLKNHLHGQVQEAYGDIVKYLLRYINSFSEKVEPLLARARLNNEEVEIIKSYMEILRSAKENAALQERVLTYLEMLRRKVQVSSEHTISTEKIKDLSEIYDEFVVKIIKYFDVISQQIKELFDRNGDQALEYIKILINDMDVLRTIPELELKTAATYYRTVENIRSYMQQLQGEAEKLITAIDQKSNIMNQKHLARSLSRLKNAEWINQVSPGTYDNLMRRITEELVQYACQLKDNLMKIDFSLKCPENVSAAKEIVEKIESMRDLECSVPELEKYRNNILQRFLQCTQTAFDRIQTTFNLEDKDFYQIKQKLQELEEIKREYDNLHPARIYLQKQGYSNIKMLNNDIEALKTQQDQNTQLYHSLHRLESVEEEHASLLPSHHSSSEQSSFLREKGFSSYELLDETIQETRKMINEHGKNKQTYHFTDRLDASTANNAIEYIKQCEKVSYDRVRENAIDANENLRKYIQEYGAFLTQEINKTFKYTRIIKAEGDPFLYSQDLEMRLQELLSFGRFPHVFEYINGVETIEHWHQEFLDCHHQLNAKMEELKVSDKLRELRDQVIIAQALTSVDRFCATISAGNYFGSLYRQYQSEITKETRAVYRTVLDYISKEDYAHANRALEDIEDTPLNERDKSQIQHDLQCSLNKLMKNTKSIANWLDGKIERGDNREQITEIKENIDKIRIACRKHRIMELLDDTTQMNLRAFDNEINEILDRVILRGLNSIEAFMNADSFSEAEQGMENLSLVQRELAGYCTSTSVTEKSEKLRTELDSIVTTILERNDFTDVNKYTVNPPKDLLAKLKIVASHGSARFTQAYNTMLGKIRQTFILAIEEAHKAPLNERSVKIRSLNYALYFLPEDLQIQFKLQIDELSKLIVEEETADRKELITLLTHVDDDEHAIPKIGLLAERYSTRHMHDLLKILREECLQKLRTYRIDAQKSLDEQKIQSTISNFKTILKYEESVGAFIPEIKGISDSISILIMKRFSMCCDTLGNISSIEQTQIIENAFNDIIIYLDFSNTSDKRVEALFTNEVLEHVKEAFERMYQYFNENAENFRIALKDSNTNELHKTISISEKWQKFLEKIRLCSLNHHLVQNLFKEMKNVISYGDMISEFEIIINHLKDEINVEFITDQTTRFEVKREELFRNLMNAFNILKNLNLKFKDILSISIDTDTIEKEIKGKVERIKNYLLDKASKNELSSKDTDDFRMYYNHLLSFDKYIHLPGIDIRQILDESQRKILAKIDALNKQITNSISDPVVVSDALIKMKFYAENLSMFEKYINDEIDNALKRYKSSQGTAGITRLSMELEKKDIGARLISEHPILSGEDWRKRREKMQKQDDLEYVLDNLTGDDVAKDVLRKRYKTFRDKYNELLSTFLNTLKQNENKEPDLEILVSETKNLVGTVTQTAGSVTWTRNFKDNIPEVLAHIFAIWTLKNTQYYNAMRGIDESKAYLLMPHIGQVIAIFRLLGLGYERSEKTFLLFSKKIISEDLVNNLVEVGTGEGKSVVLAITACVFALTGVDVNCSCYSEVLSTRDKNDFASVFRTLGIEDRIEYGTFNKLCEQLLNEQCNVRERVRNMIGTNKKSLDAIDRSVRIRPKVLLIDEVDVFLSDKYYGGIYIPSVYLKDPSIKTLLDSIWKNKTLNSLNSIKTLPAYETCALKYSNWIFLFDEAIKDMLFALQSYQSSTYIVHNDKIVYVIGESIVDNVVRGYDTIWAYYHENEKGNISQNSLEENVGIIINCGTFSYAEMPHDFSYIGGVTGTLKTLAKIEEHILEEVYAINRKTFMPSVFGKNNRTYNPMTDVRVVEENEYFMEILGEIRVVCNANRAILVFFESEEKLMVFYNCEQLSSMKQDVQIITEKVSAKERELYIKRAATVGKITLLTRTFGRGTDFICRNQQLLANGGIHVLQTFFSEELSEEYQVMGRGARQGDRGSYRMILLDKDLEWILESSWKEEIPKIKGATFYEALNKARSIRYESKCGAKKLSIGQCKADHQASKEFMIALTSGDTETVKEFLLKQNKGANLQNKGTNLTTGTSRTVLLMDATVSMASLLSATKDTVCTMFERAATVLAEKGLLNDAFQMQFAVYRNYSSKEEKILQVSSWETKANNLRAFMSTIGPEGGMGHEAIEIGLWHAVKESKLEGSISQVILIGDAAANTEKEVHEKRARLGEKYWKTTTFSEPMYYEVELQKLKEKNIPVHTFYLNENARANFEQIASETGGRCESLNIHSSQGAESLTNFVTEEVLRKTAGDQGNALVERYREIYGFTS